MKLFAVIVCFHPDVDHLAATCKRLGVRGIRPIVVDNTDPSHLESLSFERHGLIVNGANRGIAYAQNVGLRSALEQGADAVLFLDQDSQLDEKCISALQAATRPAEAMVVGPKCIDSATGTELPAVRLGRFGLPRPVTAGDRTEPVDILISSGMVATRAALTDAGPMDEDFFIDFVDTEWCLRARGKNVSIEIEPTAVLRHSIGQGAFRIGGLRVSVHSPTRCYYQTRNCLLLLKKAHVPVGFALHQIASILVNRALLILFVPHKLTYLRAYLKGVWDGLSLIGGRSRRP